MANCNKLFFDYKNNLKIKREKNDRLKKSKDELRKKIEKHFKEKHPEYVPKFWIQGSYKMKTTILTKDDECDLDDGVYFVRDEGVSGTTLQSWVKNALEGATSTDNQHRKKCIRVIYKADYHTDFPVYYFPKEKDHPLLAVKDSDLEESDPKELYEWFNEKKDKNGQLHRTVKYLKGWGDNIRRKMPSGLAMTILASNNFSEDERDDVSLKETLKKIHTSLKNNFSCVVPATPNDDLFEDYDEAKKEDFMNELKSFKDDAIEATENETNQLKASRLWRKHLGEKFPKGKDENVDEKEGKLKGLKASILNGSAYTQRDGAINEKSEGIKNKPHTNYGG
ncbi:hypothetical protein LB465_12565 [Salegentibacter sp. LM13S]|uniref:CBASS cGAMP synthase n=1 Tax=Salegentibacter lacus TaxID=2873599 RepID=UPI001CC9600A|nr:hypothetical protein [Salegentibacter lacus]MBZ9631615.1 hypothetical protein [Salegentibacter lacus]